MATSTPYRIKSITEIHRLMELPSPHHPLIGIMDTTGMQNNTGIDAVIFDLYVIAMKRGCDKLFYGQQKYDFDEGLMGFIAPGQIMRGDANGLSGNLEGWMLFIHPDFLWNTPLAKKIKKYEFFYYAVNEALFLSEKEELLVTEIVKNIEHEYQSNIDKFSEDVIIAHLDVLLTYSERFYERQFRTRKKSSGKILDKFEDLLTEYFSSGKLLSDGLPTVQYLADALNISPKYLSSMLRALTGLTAQQHIHEKLIHQAKEKLSTTELTVSEVAYDLGFEHPASFSKFFKLKTNQSPAEFRAGFN